MIGKEIKDLRTKKEVTQEELGRAIGLTTSMIGMYETEARKPSLEVLKKLADYFNVSTDYLLYGYDKTLLVQLVNYVRDDRTYEQFAEDTEVDINELTKICIGVTLEPPSLSTIGLIAANNPVDYLVSRTDLLQAAGYLDKSTAQKINKEEIKKYRAEHKDRGGYDDDLTEEEQRAVRAFIETYRKPFRKED